MIEKLKNKYSQNESVEKSDKPKIPIWFHILLVICIALILFVPLVSQEENYVGKEILDIQFAGLNNVDTDELYLLISTKLGDKLNPDIFNNDIKSLFRTGYFSKVLMKIQVQKDGVVVIFEVIELPRVSSIRFLGVEELPTADLKSELLFNVGEVINLQKIKSGKIAIKEKYRKEGFFHAEVWYKIGKLDYIDNEQSITYIVDEGSEIPVAKVNILGAKNLDPEDLVDIIETQELGFLDDGIFDETKFEEDKFKILAYAKTRGYIDAEIDPEATGFDIRWKNPKDPSAGRVVLVTIKIIENQISYFGGYSIEHDPVGINLELNPPERMPKKRKDLKPIYDSEILLKYLEFNDSDIGIIFDESRFFRDRGYVHDQYARQGYVFSQVQPVFINVPITKENLSKYRKCLVNKRPISPTDIRCKQEAKWLNLDKMHEVLEDNPELSGQVLRHVHFVIRENNIAYIENIIIKGMDKTKEYVIRRELLIKEGQLFNKSLVDRSREKLINLGYFSEVNLQMRPGSDSDKMNLIVEVKEQPTGTISMGGGFGTVSGFSIFTEVGENNLNGYGQRITGRLEYGPLRRSVSIDWTEPWYYEACQDNTGFFWRNKLKEAEASRSIEDIEALADSLRNDYEGYGKIIRGYLSESKKIKTTEDLDWIKSRIRKLFFKTVSDEEHCYRTYPRPWSLSLGMFYQSFIFDDRAPLSISTDEANDLFESASFERNRFGLRIGTQHSFLINWAHYHFYSPSWSTTSRPTSLVNNTVLQEVDLGWQFKSSLRNGLIYSTLDNVFSPTTGTQLNFEIEFVGQYLGGEDHFNRYTASGKYYWWWFDYTFGGLFRSNALRRWRVVQEFRLKGVFSNTTNPRSGKKQDREKNPYLEFEDRQYLGGFPSLRGYDINDPLYPRVWRDGGNHMIIGGTEIRIPIEPSIIWLALFFDGGALFDNLGEYNEDLAESAASYEQNQIANRLNTSEALLVLLADQRDASSGFQNEFPFKSLFDWENPKRSVLSQRNVALDRALYSWGFGLRIQIPVLPLRLFMAQKLYYKGGKFKPIPGDDEFEFVFGIGDVRF